MKRTLLLLLLVSASLALVITLGCGKGSKDPIVAAVGNEDIPVSIITTFFEKIGATFVSADEEFRAKREALDSLVDYKLLIKGAYAAGIDRDPEVSQLVSSEKSGFLFDELYRREIVPKLSVTDKEVDDFYEKLKVEHSLAHIMVATEKTADSVATELNKGSDFGGLARALSLDQSSAVRGGELGFVSWGADIDASFRDAAYALSPGQISKPVKTQFGWHIIKVLDRRDVTDLESKERLAQQIRELLKSRKASEAEAVFLKQMEERAGVEINTEATQMLLDRLNQYFPKTLGTATRPDNYFPQPELLKPFELQMIFASYQGGEVTVEDYLKKISTVPESYRPRFDDPDSLKKVVFQLESRNIMEFEATQKKVEESEEYQKRMSDFREGVMVDRFVRSVLSREITADEEEIKQYYNSHFEEFMTPRELHLLEIEVATAEEASRIVEQLNSGTDFGTLAASKSIRAESREKRGDLGFVLPGRFPSLYDAASRLVTGQISTPIQNDEGKYSIVKLVETKESVARPVEEITGQVKQKVIDMKRTSAITDWLKDQKSKTEIKINEDALRESIDKAKYEKSK